MDLKKEQEQSLLGLVNEKLERIIIAQGNVHCPSDIEVADDETVIGEFTNFEKALFLTGKEFFEKSGQLRIFDSTKILMQNKAYRDALNDILWNSVQYRLKNKAIEAKYIGIRKGWKIVTKDDYDPFF